MEREGDMREIEMREREGRDIGRERGREEEGDRNKDGKGERKR